MAVSTDNYEGIGLVRSDDCDRPSYRVQDDNERIVSDVRSSTSTKGYKAMLKSSYSQHNYIEDAEQEKRVGLGLDGASKTDLKDPAKRQKLYLARTGYRAYKTINKLTNEEEYESKDLLHDTYEYRSKRVASLKKTQAQKKTVEAAQSRKIGDRARKATRTKKQATKKAAKKINLKNVQRALAKSPFTKMVLVGAGGILFVLMILMVLLVLMGSFGHQSNYSNLLPNEAAVASYLHEKGVDDIHIAAVIGCFKRESGNGFDVDLNPAAVESNGIGHGISQWSFERWDGTSYNRPHQGLKQYSEAEAKPWETLSLQLDYMWAEMTGEGPAAANTYVQYDHGGFLKTSTIESAVEFFLAEFLGNPGDHIDERIAYANDIYQRMLIGIGSAEGLEGASSAQIAVVQAAKTTPTTPANWCLKWVNNVYDNAGYGFPRVGSATIAHHNWGTSSNLGELKVGMIITTNVSANGDTRGHIGVYIGNNQMMDSIGYVRTMTVGDWAAAQRGEVRWGWAGGRDLSTL